MSSFVDPRGKYPLSETPRRSTRSAAVAARSSVPPSPTTRRSSRKDATLSPNPAARPPRSLNKIIESPIAERDTSSQSGAGEGRGQGRHTARGTGNASDKAQTEINSISEYQGIGHLWPDEESQESHENQKSQESQETGVASSSLPDPEDHNVSGTTLLQTDSEPDTGDADTLLMIDSLPDLHRAASAILELFATTSSTPSGISTLARALQDPKSSQSRRLQRMRGSFATQKDCFGSETYLAIEQVAAKLPVLTLSSDSATKTWHVDGILYKSNCAQLALEILTKASRADDAEDSMYDLEGKYPLPFLNVLVRNNKLDLAGQSSLRRQTFDLALEIRTQFLMTSLDSQKDRDNYDPEGLLRHAFFNENLDTQAASQDESMLRGFNLPSLQDSDGNLPEQYEDDVQDRIRDIQKYFSDGGTVDYNGLEESFPWEGFVYTVAKWLRLRNEELDRFLKTQPSVDEVREQLEEAVNNRTSLEQPVVTPEKNKKTTTTLSEMTSSQQRRRALLPAAEITEKRGDTNAGQAQAKERRKSNNRVFNDPKSVEFLLRKVKAIGQTNEPTLESAEDFGPRLSQLAAKPAEKTARPAASTSTQPGQRAEESAHVASFSTDPDQTLVGDFQEDLIIPSPQRNPQRSPQRSQPINRPRQPPPPPSTQLAAPSSQSIPSSRSILEEIKRHKKNRAFIDRQSDASRVSPIDSQRLGYPSSSQPRKRTRVEIEESDDDEYEQDRRNIDLQNKRAQKPAQPAKRQRQGDVQVETPVRPRQVPWSAAEEQHREPPSAQPPPTASYFAAATAAASPPRYSTQPSASQQSSSQTSPRWVPYGSRIPQVRRRWSTAEDNRLVELVGQYGTSWAVVKHQDEASPRPQLGDRSQVQLKDRARNLVMMWLKGGRTELPQNFNLVALKQKDVEELESRGIRIPDRPLPRNARY